VALTISPEDVKAIAVSVCAMMQEAGSDKGICSCGLSRESQSEMGHLIGRFKDLGKGNLNDGIEIFSKAVGMMAAIRKGGEKVGGAVAVFVFVSITGGVVTLLVCGAKAAITAIAKTH